MAVVFTRAVKGQDYLRMALLGPSGSGKTFTALRIATALARIVGGRVALLDTEHGSARKYADLFDFDHAMLESFAVERYIEAIRAAEAAGYRVLVIDSLSHAWAGKDGILEFVDAVARRQGGNTFGAWREASPKHNELVETMLRSNLHLIVTMRVKMEYVQEKDEKTGKTVIRKVGLQPVQRDGLEYEFDVVADLDQEHVLAVTKSRCHALADKVFRQPQGDEIAGVLVEWLGLGKPQAASAQPAPAPASAPTNGHATNGKAAQEKPRRKAVPQEPAEAPAKAGNDQPTIFDGPALLQRLYDEGTKTDDRKKYVARRIGEMGYDRAQQLAPAELKTLLDELEVIASLETEAQRQGRDLNEYLKAEFGVPLALLRADQLQEALATLVEQVMEAM